MKAVLAFAAGLVVAVVVAYGSLAAVGRRFDTLEDQARQDIHTNKYQEV